MDRAKAGSPLSANIDQLTKQGNNELQQGNLGRALEAFELAHKKALELGAAFTERACAFNLGAVCVAVGNAQDGLKMLHKALPPDGKRDGKSNGDLFYNFGLAYEALSENDKAVKYYELAVEDYQSERDNFLMEADASSKAGGLYVTLKSWLSASRCYGISARAYERLKDYENEAICMCHLATSLFQGKRTVDAVQVADECMILSQRVSQGDTLGKLYNELGLTYTQCHEFSKAAACFELALPLSRQPKGDKKREAVILQNLGAIYNSLGDFQRSLVHHEMAAAKYAELGNRASQGQCFANLAYAYSQQGDNEGAGESYLHALQAARDTDDKHAQWQAMEGMGAVAFNTGQVDRAVRYFKEALAMLAATENNPMAQQRILGKLSDALQYQLVKDAGSSKRNGYETIDPIDILVNGAPRPPTRQEMRQRDHMKQRRNRMKFHEQRLPSEHGLIALGVGEYDTDSDFSVRKLRQRPSSHKESRKWKPHGRSNHNRAATSVDGNGNAVSPQAAQFQMNRDPRLTNSEPDMQNKPSRQLSRRISSRSRRFSSEPRNSKQRRNKRPLLRSNSFDSETEWRNKMREISDFSTSEEEYRERLFPPSTDSEYEVERKRHRKPEKKHQNQLERLTNALAKALMREESDTESLLEDSLKLAEDRPELGYKSYDRKSRSGDITSRSKSRHSRSRSEPARKRQHLSNRRHHSRTETESESDSETLTASDAETNSDDVQKAVAARNNAKKRMALLTPPPVPSPLTFTYEQPVSGDPSGLPTSADGIHGANFFRGPGQHGGMQVQFQENGEGELMVTNSLYGGTGKTFKDDEPVYQTIRSVKSTLKTQDIDPQPSTSNHTADVEEGPPLPPRTEPSSGAVQEVHQQQQVKNRTNGEEIPGSTAPLGASVELPQRKSKEKGTSRMCALM